MNEILHWRLKCVRLQTAIETHIHKVLQSNFDLRSIPEPSTSNIRSFHPFLLFFYKCVHFIYLQFFFNIRVYILVFWKVTCKIYYDFRFSRLYFLIFSLSEHSSFTIVESASELLLVYRILIRGLDDRGFECRQGLGIFFFTTESRTALEPTHLPIQWVPGTLFLEVK